MNAMDEYPLEPSLKIVDKEDKFPFSLVEKRLLFQREINLHF